MSDRSYEDGLKDAYDAIVHLPEYRSSVGDRAYENGVSEGRDHAARAVRRLIEGPNFVEDEDDDA